MEKRVVITGLGVISPVGNDVPTFWNNLKEGVCGIESITDFPTDDLPVKIGGRVKGFDPDLVAEITGLTEEEVREVSATA